MTASALTLELDLVLTRHEEQELTRIAKSDPEISNFIVEARHRRHLLHIIFDAQRDKGSSVPLSVHGYLHGRNIGYTPYRCHSVPASLAA